MNDYLQTKIEQVLKLEMEKDALNDALKARDAALGQDERQRQQQNRELRNNYE